MSIRRYNPLADEWVLISPGRKARPWSGEREAATDTRAAYDPDCYLCPGNQRASGETNPAYRGTFVFTNDFAALTPDPVPSQVDDEPLFQSRLVAGTSRVICFNERHDTHIADMDVPAVDSVVDMWAEQVAELSTEYDWVQVFENRGAAMGASNPHPHGQIWALSQVPSKPQIELRTQRSYFEAHGSQMLVDYAAAEAANGSRVVVESSEWLAVVPYWATWPFETLVLPKRPVPHLDVLDRSQRTGLSNLLQDLLRRLDGVFGTSMPYSMGWHGAPTVTRSEGWQLHAHYYPPMLTPDRKKFMVGYEMMAEPQRDLTAEEAAQMLWSVT